MADTLTLALIHSSTSSTTIIISIITSTDSTSTTSSIWANESLVESPVRRLKASHSSPRWFDREDPGQAVSQGEKDYD